VNRQLRRTEGRRRVLPGRAWHTLFRLLLVLMGLHGLLMATVWRLYMPRSLIQVRRLVLIISIVVGITGWVMLRRVILASDITEWATPAARRTWGRRVIFSGLALALFTGLGGIFADLLPGAESGFGVRQGVLVTSAVVFGSIVFVAGFYLTALAPIWFPVWDISREQNDDERGGSSQWYWLVRNSEDQAIPERPRLSVCLLEQRQWFVVRTDAVVMPLAPKVVIIATPGEDATDTKYVVGHLSVKCSRCCPIAVGLRRGSYVMFWTTGDMQVDGGEFAVITRQDGVSENDQAIVRVSKLPEGIDAIPVSAIRRNLFSSGFVTLNSSGRRIVHADTGCRTLMERGRS